MNSIQFYINIMCRSEAGKKHNIPKFMEYMRWAPDDIKETAKSPKELTKLFSSLPQLFNVQQNNVILNYWIIFHINQQEWIKELLPETHKLVINSELLVSTIQYYCNVIFMRPLKSEFAANELLGYKGQAPAAIQKLTRNVKDFVLFLSTYPEIFLFKDNKISLTESALSYRSMTNIIVQLLVGEFDEIDKFIKEPSYVCNQTLYESDCLEESTTIFSHIEAIEFFYKFIWTKYSICGISLDYLINIGSKATPYIQKISRSKMALNAFLCSYPKVFTINNDIVFLTNLLWTKVGLLLCSQGRVLSLPENSTNQKQENKAINFFSDVLHEISMQNKEIVEYPINHLLYYLNVGPEKVKKIVGNVHQLKEFLNKYPDIFKISNDNVVFKKILEPANTFQNYKFTFDEAFNEAASYYSGVIYKIGGVTRISHLLSYIEQSSKQVQNIVSNLEEIKTFLYAHPGIFIIESDIVTLANVGTTFYKRNFQENHSNVYAPHKAALFYLSCMKKKKKGKMPISKLVGYRSCAPHDVHDVAKNPKELEAFLSMFPGIFTIIDKEAIIFSQETSKNNNFLLEEGLTKHYDQFSAIEFYLKVLSTCDSRIMSIKELYDCNSTPDIQSLVGSNLDEFRTFLSANSNYFIVTADNVFTKKHIPKRPISNKYEREKFRFPFMITIFTFFEKYTLNKPMFHIEYLYNNVGKHFLYNDLSNVFQSESDLLLFLSLYPQVFYIDNSRVVNIIASAREAFVCPMENIKFGKNKNINKNHDENENKKEEKSELKSSELLDNVFDLGTTKNKKINNLKSKNKNPNKKLKFKSYRPQVPKLCTIDEPQILVSMSDMSEINISDNINEIEDDSFIRNEENYSFSKDVSYLCTNVNDLKSDKYLSFNEIISNIFSQFAMNCDPPSTPFYVGVKEESMCRLIFNFFSSYTEQNNGCQLQNLYFNVGKHFWDTDESKIFKSSRELGLFLEMYPDTFCIVNQLVINLTSPKRKRNDLGYNKNLTDIDKLLTGNCQNRAYMFYDSLVLSGFFIPEYNDGWKDSVLQRTQLVEKVSVCEEICKWILQTEEIIGLDCEGINLGYAGILALIQIVLKNGKIYIFDILQDKEMMTKGKLKDVLESGSIIKVIHDCRNDYANLYVQYGVKLYNIFDTRIAHHLIKSELKNMNIIESIGFNQLCEKYGAPINVGKDEMSNIYKKNYRIWENRPLTRDMLAYAALDVAPLISHIFPAMMKELGKSSEKLIWQRSMEYPIFYLKKKGYFD